MSEAGAEKVRLHTLRAAMAAARTGGIAAILADCPDVDKGAPDRAPVPTNPAAAAPSGEQAVGDIAPSVQRRQLTIADVLGQEDVAEERKRPKRARLD